MGEQIETESGGAGVSTHPDGCRQSGGSHAVNPLLAGCLVGAEKHAHGLEMKNNKIFKIKL